MAGTGPAPTDPAQRRRRNVPERGEWVDIPPLQKTVLPALPRRSKGEGQWSSRARAQWAAWRADPVTQLFGPSEIAMAVELAFTAELIARGDVRLLPSLWQGLDRLGLSPKGKRDLRWRIVTPIDEVSQERGKRRSSVRSRLKAVDRVASAAG